MGKAAKYILRVAPDRRDVLLKAAQEPDSWVQQRTAEPVHAFSHSKNSPLVVLASFDAGAITHLAEGRKGVSFAVYFFGEQTNQLTRTFQGSRSQVKPNRAQSMRKKNTAYHLERRRDL